MKTNQKAYLVLDTIRSAHNVGAIFRTAEAIGISRIYLSGYTPAPIDRFGRPRKDIAKTALGAEKIVPWKQCEDISVCIAELKKEKAILVAVERTLEAIDYKKCALGRTTAFIFGNERDGVSKEVRAHADEVIQIPMSGMKESLNVSVAVGIVLYRLLDI